MLRLRTRLQGKSNAQVLSRTQGVPEHSLGGVVKEPKELRVGASTQP